MPDVPNAGLYGAGATLPSGAGPVDPPILTGNYPYPSPTPYIMNPSSAGFTSPTLFPGGDYAGQINDYVPSDIMQAYMDFYANNPQASGATAPNYPAPGTGSQSGNQGFISRLINHTPQGMLRNAISNAVRANQTRANMQPNSGSWQGAPNVPPGGALFGYNPNSGGAGGTPRFDYATGRTSPTPSTNPLYSTGGAFQPVANAPADIRFAPGSGTGNYQADMTTRSFELSGGYPGTPNRTPGTSDRGHDRFYNAVMQSSPEGGFTEGTPFGSQAQSAQSRGLYQQALQAVPMGNDGFSAGYVQKLNDWITANQPTSLYSALNPSPTSNNMISGPPRLPGT